MASKIYPISQTIIPGGRTLDIEFSENGSGTDNTLLNLVVLNVGAIKNQLEVEPGDDLPRPGNLTIEIENKDDLINTTLLNDSRDIFVSVDVAGVTRFNGIIDKTKIAGASIRADQAGSNTPSIKLKCIDVISIFQDVTGNDISLLSGSVFNYYSQSAAYLGTKLPDGVIDFTVDDTFYWTEANGNTYGVSGSAADITQLVNAKFFDHSQTLSVILNKLNKTFGTMTYTDGGTLRNLSRISRKTSSINFTESVEFKTFIRPDIKYVSVVKKENISMGTQGLRPFAFTAGVGAENYNYTYESRTGSISDKENKNILIDLTGEHDDSELETGGMFYVDAEITGAENADLLTIPDSVGENFVVFAVNDWLNNHISGAEEGMSLGMDFVGVNDFQFRLISHATTDTLFYFPKRIPATPSLPGNTVETSDPNSEFYSLERWSQTDTDDIRHWVKTQHIVQTCKEVYQRLYMNNKLPALDLTVIGYFPIHNSFDYQNNNYVITQNWEYDILKDETKFRAISVGTQTELKWGLPEYS